MIATVTLGRINLRLVFQETKIESEDTFLLSINDEVVSQAASGRAILGWRFLCEYPLS